MRHGRALLMINRSLGGPDALDFIDSPHALFVANHSGGKDSQAMLIYLAALVPAHRLVVIHASLGEVEWPGASAHAEAHAALHGVAFVVARSVKTFFQMVEHRFVTRPDVPCWPSSGCRQCTSDLKRGPIQREIRRYAKAHGFTTIVNCVGLRAAESASRAKAPIFRRNASASKAGREWYEWSPIHSLTTAQVFAMIRDAGQQPHAAYGMGNERLSCVFCIMGSKNDIANGAQQNPGLFEKYVQLERRTGYTMHQSRQPLSVLAGTPTGTGVPS